MSSKLWSASVTAKPEHIAAFAEALDDEALALTTLAKPRGKTATAEALYQDKPDRASIMARLAIASTLVKTRAPKLIIKPIPALDWLEKVAQDFPPLPIAGWIIHGTPHKKMISNPRRALEINASSAFGTGEHPTTRGCLIMLSKVLKRKTLQRHPREGGGPMSSKTNGMPACAGMTGKTRVLDMGCGSGILAMAAAKGNPARAVGIDLDPQSITTARENIARNGLKPRVHVALGNGYNSNLARKKAPYDLIMANIFAKPLAYMAKDLKRHLKPGGVAILAGLLTSQANMVLAAHKAQRLHLIRRLQIGEWTMLALKRPRKA